MSCRLSWMPHPPSLSGALNDYMCQKVIIHVVKNLMSSQAITDLHLEDLPGIKSHTLTQTQENWN